LVNRIFRSVKLYDVVILLVVISIAFVVFGVSNTITKNKIESIKKEKYSIYAKNIKNEIEILIKNKKELTLSIALALSKNENIIKALNTNDISILKLKEFSNTLKKTTKLQNTWFQIIDNKGITFYRSWVKKRGDAIIKSRLDVAQMIQNPHTMCTISTGKFDMTFKSMVPIYDDTKFIGMFEIITHFNSISQSLLETKIDSIVLVDKSYKKQLTRNLTKIFIDDYYVSNQNAKKEFINIVKKNKVDYYFNNNDEYILDIENNQFIITYDILDINANSMGKIIAFKNINLLNIDDVNQLKTNMMFYVTLIVLIIAIIGHYLVTRKHSKELDDKVIVRTKELSNEKNYIQTILDTNPSMILVTKDSSILRGNKRFLEFFKFSTLEKFKEKYNCICDFFETLDDIPFPEDKMINNQIWSCYLALKTDEEHFVSLKYEDKLYYFTVNALRLTNSDEILLTFQNITELKTKDKLLFEQSKMASMGEMIGNIAHQWRQPLGIISSGATGMKMQQAFGTLTDDIFIETCDLINDNAQYLSNTIDDFRNFIKGDRIKSDFVIIDTIEKVLNLTSPSSKTHNITLLLEINDDNKTVRGYPNELIQCLINIYNNAKDVLTKVNEEDRFIFFTIKIIDKNLFIDIKDSGGGIEDTILTKVFDPYFTTKHASIGTGLGLHMTYNLIVDGMNGEITAQNTEFEYKGKEYKGAQFKLKIPIF